MRAERGEVALLELHLARLVRSAGELGFALDLAPVTESVRRAAAFGEPARLRLCLWRDGTHDVAASPLPPEAWTTVAVYPEPIAEAGTWRCTSKTSARAHYDRALVWASGAGADEPLLINARGEVMEGARSNVFVRRGDALLTPEAVDAYRERLMPLATILTPNTHEAEALLGWPVRTLDDARRAAAELREAGAGAVLVKGGHLEGEQDAVDVLADDAGERLYRAERIETTSTHGTGCTLASAIAAYLASGADLRDAVSGAKRYLTEAIRHAPGLGSGNGPVRHLWRLTQL